MKKGARLMADLVTFVPQSDLDARANLAAFIELCRTRLTDIRSFIGLRGGLLGRVRYHQAVGKDQRAATGVQQPRHVQQAGACHGAGTFRSSSMA